MARAWHSFSKSKAYVVYVEADAGLITSTEPNEHLCWEFVIW